MSGFLESQVYQTVSIDGRTPWDLHYKKYKYAAASNIDKIWDLRDYNHVDYYTGGGNLPYHLEIQHDSLYRVVEVDYDRTAAELAAHTTRGTFRRKMTFGYSPTGNLIKRSTDRGNEDGTTTTNPTEEFYEKWLGSDINEHSDHPHAFGQATQPTADATVTAQYDANGNMTELVVDNTAVDPDRYERFFYTWNHYDQLIKIEKYDSRTAGTPIAILYAAYDSGGQRVIKSEYANDTSKDTLYVTDGMEIRHDQYIRFITDGTQKIARIGLARPYGATGPPPPDPPETRLFYVSDHINSTSTVVIDHDDISHSGDERGCVVSAVSYLPYGGKEKQSNGQECGMTVDTFYQFSGKEIEKGFGLQYFGARWLNNSLTLFISSDTLGVFSLGVQHIYAYTDSRPYFAVDPDGNSWLSAAKSLFMTQKKKISRRATKGTSSKSGAVTRAEYISKMSSYKNIKRWWKTVRKMKIGGVTKKCSCACNQRFNKSRFSKYLFSNRSLKTRVTTYYKKPFKWKHKQWLRRVNRGSSIAFYEGDKISGYYDYYTHKNGKVYVHRAANNWKREPVPPGTRMRSLTGTKAINGMIMGHEYMIQGVRKSTGDIMVVERGAENSLGRLKKIKGPHGDSRYIYLGSTAKFMSTKKNTRATGYHTRHLIEYRIDTGVEKKK